MGKMAQVLAGDSGAFSDEKQRRTLRAAVWPSARLPGLPGGDWGAVGSGETPASPRSQQETWAKKPSDRVTVLRSSWAISPGTEKTNGQAHPGGGGGGEGRPALPVSSSNQTPATQPHPPCRAPELSGHREGTSPLPLPSSEDQISRPRLERVPGPPGLQPPGRSRSCLSLLSAASPEQRHLQVTVTTGAEGRGETVGTCGAETASPAQDSPLPSTRELSSPRDDAAGAGTRRAREARHLSLFWTLGFLTLRHPFGALKNDSRFGFQADDLNLLWPPKQGSNIIPRSSVPDGRGEEAHRSSSHTEEDSEDSQLPLPRALPLTCHHLHLLPRSFRYRPGAFGTPGSGLKAQGWAHRGHRGLRGLTPLPSSLGGPQSLSAPFPHVPLLLRGDQSAPTPLK